MISYKHACAFIITALPFGQGDAYRTSVAIAHSMEPGMPSTCCPSDTAPPFLPYTRSSAVRFYVRGIDHETLRRGSLVCQDIENALKHAKATPTHETIIKGFVRTIRFERIFPWSSVTYNIDNASNYAAVIQPPYPVG